MDTTMNEYQTCIVEAIRRLVQSDGDLITTQPREECMNHRLALYLERALCKKKLLDGCCVDMEYDKYKEDEKKTSDGRHIRPDVIAHERKSGSRRNLIVIEAKKGYASKADKHKVDDLVNSRNYQYSLGAVISYLPKKQYVRIIFLTRGGGWTPYWLDKDSGALAKTWN